MSEATRPWGATRLARFTGTAGAGYTRLELDPVTQITRYLDEHNQPVQMAKHGTNKQQTTSNPTGGGGDGGGPNPPKPDDVNLTDYVPD